MQEDANNSLQSARNEEFSSEQALNLQLLGSENEEMPQKGSDWLNQEFSRFPYKLYKFWSILTFGIVGVIIYLYMKDILTRYKDLKNYQLEKRIIQLALSSIIQLILLFGCSQMLYGMTKKKAEVAQKGIMKFQISMIGSLSYSFFEILQMDSTSAAGPADLLTLLFIFCLPLNVAINLVGGFAVLKAFKKNHPLARSEDSLATDFLQQNEVIASEILKYDLQLDRWPYVVYKFWFVLSSFWGILFVCQEMILILRKWPLDRLGVLQSILNLQFFFINAFASYEMIFALRRKISARSRKAIFLLKICIPLTVVLVLLWSFLKGKIPDSQVECVRFFWAPFITLIGALKTEKILKERDEIAKFSNFNDNYSDYIQ